MTLKSVMSWSLVINTFSAVGGILFLWVLNQNNINNNEYLYLASSRLLAGPILILFTAGTFYAASRYSLRTSSLGLRIKFYSLKIITISFVLVNVLLNLLNFDNMQIFPVALLILIPINNQIIFIFFRGFYGEKIAGIIQMSLNFIFPAITIMFSRNLDIYINILYFASLILGCFVATINAKKTFKVSVSSNHYISVLKFCAIKSLHGFMRRFSPFVFLKLLGLIFPTHVVILSVVAYMMRILDLIAGSFFRISQVYIQQIRKVRLPLTPYSNKSIYVCIIIVSLNLLFFSNILINVSLLCLSYIISVALQMHYESMDYPVNTAISTLYFYIPISIFYGTFLLC
jgi:hypothetical protein